MFVRAPRVTSLLCAIAALLQACSSNAQPTISGGSSGAVATIVVSLDSATLAVSHQSQATATAHDAAGTVLSGAQISWSSSNTQVATVSTSGVVTAVAAGSATIIATSGSVTGQAAITVTSSTSSPATVLFEEHYEDTNLGARGWYDLTGTIPLSSTEHIPGSTKSLQVAYAVGTVMPTGLQARHLFAPTNSVYIRYWVKYSSNWIGSNQTSHPHEFYILTTEDGQYAGPAYNPLTMYIETNFVNGAGTPRIESQDAKNIDVSHINVDLTNVTEARAVSGCNGSPDGPTNCYNQGQWNNTRIWSSAQAVFSNTAGPSYKGDWHKVEAFMQLNTIANGKGNRDGVVQYWFDGQLLIDRHDVYLRTGVHPTMQFNQLFFGPYIGIGSPVAQTSWFDDLSVQTARPANP